MRTLQSRYRLFTDRSSTVMVQPPTVSSARPYPVILLTKSGHSLMFTFYIPLGRSRALSPPISRDRAMSYKIKITLPAK